MWTVCTKDPNKFADAVKYDQVTFKEVINRDLKVMDSTAFSLCKDNDMSILVFNLDDPEMWCVPSPAKRSARLYLTKRGKERWN